MPKAAIDFARAYADQKLREHGGKNRGVDIDKFNQFCKAALGSPYCASGLSYCFHKAALSGADGTLLPYSASSQSFKKWAKKFGRLSYDPDAMLNWKGALFGWTNADKVHGHIGLVEKRLTDHGQVVAISTIEFNTDAIANDRDGDGCYRVKRSNFKNGRLWHKGKKLWFIDVSGIAGGGWWQ